jgi:phosphate transport system substrate-binding protein
VSSPKKLTWGRSALRSLAVSVVALLLAPACQGDPPPPPSRPAALSAPDLQAPLVVMGTGAMTPLARRLAEASLADGGANVVVEDSVGSGGGIRAVADGAIDIGLLSRPLGPREQGLGLVVVPIAKSAVVIAANPRVQAASVGSDELVALVRGDRITFSDGRPAVMLLRDRDESANLALELQIPALKAAREAAYAGSRLRVLYYDEAMIEALSTSSGALGVIDLAIATTTRTSLKVLALDGVLPSREDIASGRWRATRELSFVYRADRAARVAAFVAYVRSPKGRAVIEGMHAVPLPLTPADLEP